MLQANAKLNTHRQMAPFRNGSVLYSIRWFQCRRDRPKWQNEANTSKIITIITICLLLHSAHRQALGLAVCAGFVLLCSTSTSHFPSLSPAAPAPHNVRPLGFQSKYRKKSIEVADNNKRKKCLQTRVQKCGYVSHCASLV